MKSVIEKILDNQKIRDILLSEENDTYGKEMGKNYPKGGAEGKINQLATGNKDFAPTIKPNDDKTPAFNGTTGGSAKGLSIPTITRRAGQKDYRGKIVQKA